MSKDLIEICSGNESFNGGFECLPAIFCPFLSILHEQSESDACLLNTHLKI